MEVLRRLKDEAENVELNKYMYVHTSRWKQEYKEKRKNSLWQNKVEFFYRQYKWRWIPVPVFTPEEAWRSLEKVNQLIFSAGDHIRFRRGGEWHGMLRFQGNGSAWSPIAVEAYGGRRAASNTW